MKITFSDKVLGHFEGIGASGAWWSQCVGGWNRINESTGEDVRDEIMRLLYDKQTGIGLRIYRYNLGSGSATSGKGDYSDPFRRAQSFIGCDGKPDYSLDKEAVLMMKKAVRYGADEIIFFVNSPLESLTRNHLGHTDKNKPFTTNLSRRNYKPFADYCLNCAAHFIGEGIPVKYLSPVNEPVWKWTGGQEGCHYSTRQVSLVMKTFAEKMAQRNDIPGLMLSGAENGDIRYFNKSHTRAMMKYKCVRDYIDGIDVHSYFVRAVPGRFINDRLGYLKRYRRWMDRKFPDVKIKMSEWCHMCGGTDTGMKSALVTAKTMFEDFSILNVCSWQHWIACSFYDFCDGLIYIDKEKQTYELTKRYYVTGNFSKYIPFGAERIEAFSDNPDISVLVFTYENKRYIILLNSTKAFETVTADYDCKASLTDELHSLDETSYRAGDSIAIPPESVITICETVS